MSRATIYALASGAGRAGVAVIRMSGDGSGEVLSRIAGKLPVPRRATLARLRDPLTGIIIDHGLVVWFPGPASFTGEDCAEFHIHGGRAVLEALLIALGRFGGCRLAEAGEFTRRAFLNDKMDLAEVEGLADLIDAQTEAQRRQGLRQLEGALGLWVERQKQLLLSAAAAAESAIDFADEGDVAGDFEAEVRARMADLGEAIRAELAMAESTERVRDGLVVAIMGPPNVGKSTLLNALARREAAIVSPYAGTTRDLVEVQLDLGGFLVLCIDTAGLRDTVDPIEREGIARARTRAASADLILWLFDARVPQLPDASLDAGRVWSVATKIDLLEDEKPVADFTIAVPTGAGVATLITALRARVDTDGAGTESGVVTRLRHRRALQEAQALLDRAGADRSRGLELMAEDLRAVSRALDGLLGRIEPEAVLGEIFARFCIGK